MEVIDSSQAVERLMRFLAVEGVTGQERAIGAEIVAALREAGVARKCIRFDGANKNIPLPTETGNLIVELPGAGGMKSAPPLLFMTHMDTVPLCAGAKPQRKHRKIINTAKSALGGDNRTGCGVLVTLAAELRRQKLDHPPLKLLFTVREESGLWGARNIDKADFKGIKTGFNFDGRAANNVIIGAVGADRWEAEIHGHAAHAGGAPEKGVSATLILAQALAELHKNGWFGKVVKGGKSGTSNVGPVSGLTGGPAGDATNVVTDYVRVRGECRSHDAKFFKEITAAYKNAFALAAKAIVNSEGKSGRVKFSSRTDYHPFLMQEAKPVVQRAKSAVAALGMEPDVRVANGGLDANWMVRHGIPTVTFGAGQNEVHTVKEWINLTEYERACNLAVTLATMHA